jgi:hypothetical protein
MHPVQTVLMQVWDLSASCLTFPNSFSSVIVARILLHSVGMLVLPPVEARINSILWILGLACNAVHLFLTGFLAHTYTVVFAAGSDLHVAIQSSTHVSLLSQNSVRTQAE